MANSYKVGILGTGKMGGAIAHAILDKNLVCRKSVFVFDKQEEKLTPFIQKGAKSSSLKEIANKADIIIIAVKPDDMKNLLESLKGKLNPQQVVISIAAGITICFISKILGESIPVVRVMPNAAISVDEGTCALSTGSTMDAQKIGFIERIFKQLGQVVELPEEKLDAVTGLSGSGPAYVYMMIEGLIQGGERAGLSREISRKLAIQTVLGAAKIARETDKSMQELILAIATPGGTTARGLKVLDEGDFVDLLSRAVVEAAKRAKKINQEIESKNEH